MKGRKSTKPSMAKKRAVSPESLWTKNTPGCARLSAMPDSSLRSGEESVPTVSGSAWVEHTPHAAIWTSLWTSGEESGAVLVSFSVPLLLSSPQAANAKNIQLRAIGGLAVQAHVRRGDRRRDAHDDAPHARSEVTEPDAVADALVDALAERAAVAGASPASASASASASRSVTSERASPLRYGRTSCAHALAIADHSAAPTAARRVEPERIGARVVIA